MAGMFFSHWKIQGAPELLAALDLKLQAWEQEFSMLSKKNQKNLWNLTMFSMKIYIPYLQK